MSLDKLAKNTITSRKVTDIVLFTPPEYDLNWNAWKELVERFNATSKPAKVAMMIRHYIQTNNPGKKFDFEKLITISDIREENGVFKCDAEFVGDKAGLTALYIYMNQDLQFAFVMEPGGKGPITHVVLTYIPE